MLLKRLKMLDNQTRLSHYQPRLHLAALVGCIHLHRRRVREYLTLMQLGTFRPAFATCSHHTIKSFVATKALESMLLFP